VLVRINFDALKRLNVGRWLLYEASGGEVVRAANSNSQAGAAPSLLFQIEPPVLIQTFLTRFPEAIEVIEMALINASEPATNVTATIPNSPTFTVRQETVVTAGTPVQAAALAVPFDRAVTVQNSPTNAANAVLFVANSSANALLATARVQLTRSQSLVLNVDNLDDIWLNSNNNGVTATLVVEA